MNVHKFRFLQVSVFFYRCTLINWVGIKFPVLKNLVSKVKREEKRTF